MGCIYLSLSDVLCQFESGSSIDWYRNFDAGLAIRFDVVQCNDAEGDWIMQGWVQKLYPHRTESAQECREFMSMGWIHRTSPLADSRCEKCRDYHDVWEPGTRPEILFIKVYVSLQISP